MKKIFVPVFVFFCLTSVAHANYIFSPSITHFSRDLDPGNNQATTEVAFTYIDLRLGYTFDFGLYVGGLYSLIDESSTDSSSDFYVGPSIGYVYGGANLLVSYLPIGESDLETGGVKYSQGTGWQVDLGYTVPINKQVSLGPTLSYRAIKFDSSEVLGISSPADRSFDNLTPYITLWWNFAD